MFTSEKVVEVLETIGVSIEQINKWENYFGIRVPCDKNGRKFYNNNHIKTFKTIKKLLALGYGLVDIKNKLNENIVNVNYSDRITVSRNATNPMYQKPVNFQYTNTPLQATRSDDNLQLIMLIERLMDEKNNLAQDKEYLLEQVHLLEMQKKELSNASLEYIDQISKYSNQIEALEYQLNSVVPEINGNKFIGAWTGKAKLIKVNFDNVDIEIPKERTKAFKISEPPQRHYGSMAVFVSSFNSEDDPLWKRVETYRLAFINDEELTGELDVEYLVDDVPVAKAIYAINCSKEESI